MKNKIFVLIAITIMLIINIVEIVNYKKMHFSSMMGFKDYFFIIILSVLAIFMFVNKKDYLQLNKPDKIIYFLVATLLLLISLGFAVKNDFRKIIFICKIIFEFSILSLLTIGIVREKRRTVD
jgi:hypothetical protein